jgi:hypothetical protein
MKWLITFYQIIFFQIFVYYLHIIICI